MLHGHAGRINWLLTGQDNHQIRLQLNSANLELDVLNALYQTLGYQDTALTEYFDEYEYPLEDGGFGLARDLCRYLVKAL